MSRGIELAAPRKLAELAESLGGELDAGVAAACVQRLVRPPDAQSDDDLVLLLNPRELQRALGARGVVLCSAELAQRVPAGRRWVHAHALWVASQLMRDPMDEPLPASEQRALVSPRAELGPDVTIGAGAVVHAGARLGAGSRIGENSVVYPRVEIGKRVEIGALCVIGRAGFGWTAAPDGTRVRVPQLGGVVIEDDVEVGPLCSIDSGTLGPTRIGRGVKLDAQVHVGHNVEIGEQTLVAAQSGFAGSARIGAFVLVGGQAGITDHARVGAGARIAAKSGVIGDVPEGAVVAGFPALPRVRWLRGMARLMRASKKEP